MVDVLGSVSKALGLSGSGEVPKLEIQSWKDGKREGDPTEEYTFKAFINPDEFTLNYNVITTSSGTNPPGEHSNPGKVLSVAPLEITLKFYLDGTGAIGKKCDVPEEIKQFYKVVGYDGANHNTRFLRIIWGSLTLLRSTQYALDCILKNASLQYKLFKTDGTPLRVIITATFIEALSPEIIPLEFPKKSPDLTHVRITKEGDTLPALAYEIYGDIKYYLEIAKANGLQSFRRLEPNQKLFFPPFDRHVTRKTNG